MAKRNVGCIGGVVLNMLGMPFVRSYSTAIDGSARGIACHSSIDRKVFQLIGNLCFSDPINSLDHITGMSLFFETNPYSAILSTVLTNLWAQLLLSRTLPFKSLEIICMFFSCSAVGKYLITTDDIFSI